MEGLGFTWDREKDCSFGKEIKNSHELVQNYVKRKKTVENRLAKIRRQEELYRINFDNSYNQKIDKWSEWKLNFSIDTLKAHLEYKEKLILYSKIADLAYADYKIWSKVKITQVHIDLLEYPYIAWLVDKPTENDKYFISKMQPYVKYAWEITYLINPSNFKDNLQYIKPALEQIKQERKVQLQRKLSQLKGFKIIEFEKTNSGFAAVAFEDKNWNIYVGIRWTEFSWNPFKTDWKDVKADIQLVIKHIPDQVKDLIKFIQKLKSDYPNKKIVVVWHSLWWALTQICTTLFPNIVIESYTFNSPWADNLKWTISWYDSFKKLYESNRFNNKVRDKIFNVRWDGRFSPITDLWEDIWNNEIIVKWVSSHSIVKLIEALEDPKTKIKIIHKTYDKKTKYLFDK